MTVPQGVNASFYTAPGGRGDLVGSYNNTGILFAAANLNWKF